MRYLEQVAGRS